MKPETLRILRCPLCHASLEVRAARAVSDSGRLREGVLRCAGCGQDYPVLGWVPRLVPPDAFTGEERKGLAAMASDGGGEARRVEEIPSSADGLREEIERRSREKILYTDLPPKLAERARKDLAYRVEHTEDKEKFVATARSYVSGRPERILEIGGGQGGTLSSFCNAFEPRTAVLLDIDPEWVELAQLRDPGTEVLRGDATCMPLIDGAFDLMVTTATLEHVRDWRGALREMARVSEGGLLCYNPNGRFPYDVHLDAPFVTWLPPGPAARVAHAYHRLRRTGRTLESIRAELEVTFYIPRSAVVRELRTLGLTVENAFAVFLKHSVSSRYHMYGGRLMSLLRRHPWLRTLVAKAFLWTGSEPNVYLFYSRPRPETGPAAG